MALFDRVIPFDEDSCVGHGPKSSTTGSSRSGLSFFGEFTSRVTGHIVINSAR